MSQEYRAEITSFFYLSLLGEDEGGRGRRKVNLQRFAGLNEANKAPRR